MFNEERIVHARRAHMIVVPRLMTHLWITHLGKDVDVLMIITAGDHFWDRSQHEPLILTMVLPSAHVKTYRGPWVAHGLKKP